MANKIIYVKSSSDFPSWKNPCPVCGSRYEKGKKSGISSTRDGSRAWCYGCHTNWEIGKIETPAGWAETGAKLGVKPQPDGFQVLTNSILRIESFLESTSDGEYSIHCKEWNEKNPI